MRIISFPRLVKWMFLTAVAFLIFMTMMRFAFFFHFRPSQYSFSNSFKAILLGLNFDTRIVCGIVLFPYLVGSLHLSYNKKNRLTSGSIVQIVITLLVMVLLIIFMKKGHVPVSSLIYPGIVFALIFVWLLVTKNCNPFENSFSRKVFKIYFLIITVLLVFLYAVDFEHYDYVHQRLNASVLNYLEDAKISMNMVWETYHVFILLILIIICTTFLYGLIHR